MSSTSIQPSLFTYEQAAQWLNVRQSWLEAAVQHRKVPHHRLGRHVRFTPDDLDQIVAETGHPAVDRRRR